MAIVNMNKERSKSNFSDQVEARESNKGKSINKLEKIFLKDNDNKYFFYKRSHVEYKVKKKNILYFESQGRKVRMITTREDVIFYATLNSILYRINSEKFIRVHKGFIVNYDYVIAFSSKQLKMVNHTIIPIGVSRQKELKQVKEGKGIIEK